MYLLGELFYRVGENYLGLENKERAKEYVIKSKKIFEVQEKEYLLSIIEEEMGDLLSEP